MKEHFVIEQIKSQKWEREARSAEMHVCVGWYVKWNSLWCYTMLLSYNFTEWMISLIVTVRLWRHSNMVWIRPDPCIPLANPEGSFFQVLVGFHFFVQKNYRVHPYCVLLHLNSKVFLDFTVGWEDVKLWFSNASIKIDYI